MDKPVLIIEMPELSYEQTAGVEDFLHALIKTFENHYARQLREYYQRLNLNQDTDIDDLL